MLPTQLRKKPNVLTELTLEEISLVDKPSNRNARVALFKRDDSQDRQYPNSQEKPKMSFKKILKSGTATREQICEGVAKRALKLARREGVEVNSNHLAQAWQTDGAYEMHERAPKPVAKKSEPRMFRATEAESELDERARKIMKRSGMSYPQAASQALQADPALYEQYQAELLAGSTYAVPQPTEYLDVPTAKRASKPKVAAADDASTCDECSAAIDPKAKFCPECGAEQ